MLLDHVVAFGQGTVALQTRLYLNVRVLCRLGDGTVERTLFGERHQRALHPDLVQVGDARRDAAVETPDFAEVDAESGLVAAVLLCQFEAGTVDRKIHLRISGVNGGLSYSVDGEALRSAYEMLDLIDLDPVFVVTMIGL